MGAATRMALGAVVSAVAAHVVVGCGESPQERFVREADAACARVDRRFSQVAERPDVLARVYPAARRAYGELATIEVPEESRAQFSRYLELSQRRIDLLASALAEPANDVDRDSRMKRAEALRGRTTEIARKLGLSRCG